MKVYVLKSTRDLSHNPSGVEVEIEVFEKFEKAQKVMRKELATIYDELISEGCDEDELEINEDDFSYEINECDCNYFKAEILEKVVK